MNISQSLNDSDSDEETFILKDQNGTTLDTVTAFAESASSITFDFTDSSFVVPAAQTKQLYVYGNVLEFEDDGDVIQMWLSDDSPNNICYGIDGAGNTCNATEIFAGDIFAGVLVNPS